MSGKLEPLRQLLEKKPFRFLRDLFVQTAWRIDPDLNALRWQVLEIALSQSRKSQPFSWAKYDQLYRQLNLHLKNDAEWRLGPKKAWSVALGPLNALGYLGGERSDVRALDFGCGGHFSDSTGLILYLCGAHSVDCMELERVVSGFDTGAALELVHWIEDQLITNASALCPSGVKIDDARLQQAHRAALLESADVKNSIPVKLIAGDIFQMNWKNGRFDLIVSNAVLEHVTDPPKIWEELKRLTKVGGVMHHIIDFRDHRAYACPECFTATPTIQSLADWSDPGTNGWQYLDWLNMIKADSALEIVACRPTSLNGAAAQKQPENKQIVADCEFIIRRVK